MKKIIFAILMSLNITTAISMPGRQRQTVFVSFEHIANEQIRKENYAKFISESINLNGNIIAWVQNNPQYLIFEFNEPKSKEEIIELFNQNITANCEYQIF